MFHSRPGAGYAGPGTVAVTMQPATSTVAVTMQPASSARAPVDRIGDVLGFVPGENTAALSPISRETRRIASAREPATLRRMHRLIHRLCLLVAVAAGVAGCIRRSAPPPVAVGSPMA